ncbi:MAG TPA: MBL fold metallo-hydrolase [Stellaceae bacterium]|jgi:glyoxylase-like metal-dependent hydrolase (beta-lactamase superfamily II)|nr:MBL fold metallo-hydrolase [Stellaceae bacterium]
MTGAAPGGAALRFPHETPPAPGAAIEVAPGLRWLRMPLPFQLNHINLWLVEDGPGWTIIDTGINNAATKGLWEQVFDGALDGRKVTRLICTHYHPDHMGLAGWLTQRLQIELWTTPGEWQHAREAIADRPGTFQDDLMSFYRRIGFADLEATLREGRPQGYRTLVTPVPERFHPLADGMELAIGARRWRVIIGRGHAPEHACLYCAELDLLIAGDQVLPKISPNVSLWPRAADQDPLGSFIASLATLKRAVPDSAFVLPSHNLPFFGLHARLDELQALHEARLAEIVEHCRKPRTGAEIVPVLFRRALDGHQIGFAIGETMAHLARAVADGALARHEREDGVWMFERV